jgi:phosphatidylglycerophosphatase A
MLQHPLRWLALGLGSGLSPIAPGTVGSFLAWGLYGWIAPQFPGVWMAGFLLLAFAIGIVACKHTGEALGVSDHGGIVWDEFVAVWLVLAVVPPGFWWALTGVLLFRFFDIVKPQPVRYFDAKWKFGYLGGFGVMLDDLVAAGYTLLTLALVKRVFM